MLQLIKQSCRDWGTLERFGRTGRFSSKLFHGFFTARSVAKEENNVMRRFLVCISSFTQWALHRGTDVKFLPDKVVYELCQRTSQTLYWQRFEGIHRYYFFVVLLLCWLFLRFVGSLFKFFFESSACSKLKVFKRTNSKVVKLVPSVIANQRTWAEEFESPFKTGQPSTA